jgi:hypothetical protein
MFFSTHLPFQLWKESISKLEVYEIPCFIKRWLYITVYYVQSRTLQLGQIGSPSPYVITCTIVKHGRALISDYLQQSYVVDTIKREDQCTCFVQL